MNETTGWDMFSDDGTRQVANRSAQGAIIDRLSGGALASLARSPEPQDRAAAAEHVGTPVTTLLRLAEDPSMEVRRGVARNRRAGVPLEVHEDLAKDKSVDVLYALIANPTVPEALVARLARHRHREYAKAARRRLASPDVESAGEEPAPQRRAASPVPARVPSLPAKQELYSVASAGQPNFAVLPTQRSIAPVRINAAPRSRAEALEILQGAGRS